MQAAGVADIIAKGIFARPHEKCSRLMSASVPFGDIFFTTTLDARSRGREAALHDLEGVTE